MNETVRFFYYHTVDGVRCTAHVNRANVETFGRDRDETREAMIAKLTKLLTEGADECEDIEIKY